MEREIHVFMDGVGETAPVGTLWARTRGARQTASFEYDRSWLARRDAFALDPLLPAGPGPFHTDRPLFNAFTDPAPDRWGQTLIRRNELRRASAEGRQPKTLLEVDFLVLVDDETRLGALRFKESEDGPFVAPTARRVPPLVDLPRLLSASTRVLDSRESDDDLRLLLAPIFGMTAQEARATAAEVGRAVQGWRETAARLGIAPNEVDRMSSAFDHDDLKAAA